MQNFMIIVFVFLLELSLFAQQKISFIATASAQSVANEQRSALDEVYGFELIYDQDETVVQRDYFLHLLARHDNAFYQTQTTQIDRSFTKIQGIVGTNFYISKDFIISLGVGIGSNMYKYNGNYLNWYPFIGKIAAQMDLLKNTKVALSYTYEYAPSLSTDDVAMNEDDTMSSSIVGLDIAYNFYEHFDLLLGYEYSSYKYETNDLFDQHTVKLGIGYNFY